MRKIIPLLGGGLLGAATLLVCSMLSPGPDNHQIRQGARTFKIPEINSVDTSLLSRFQQLMGIDDASNSYMLIFSGEEVAASLPGYRPRTGEYSEDIRAIMTVFPLGKPDPYQTAPRFKDLWSGTGSYNKSIVEADSATPWQRVYRKIEYSYSWSVVKFLPKKEDRFPSDVFDFWVADCLSGHGSLSKTGRTVTCRSGAYQDGVAVEFFISEENLELTEDVRIFLLSEVLGWEEMNP